MAAVRLPELVVRPDDESDTYFPGAGGDTAAPPGGTGGGPAAASAPETDTYFPGAAIGTEAVRPPPGPAPSLPSDDNPLTRAIRSAKDAYTGASQIPDDEADTPEYFDSPLFSPVQKAKLAFVSAATGDPQALQNAALGMLGKGAAPHKDAQGNLMVRVGSQRAYLDRPGMSKANAFDLAGYVPNLMVGGPIGAALRFAGRGALNTIVRGVFQGAGQATVESAKQAAGLPLGSGQFDWRRPAAAAIGGAVAEPALATTGAALRGAGNQLGQWPAQPLLTGKALDLAPAAKLSWADLNASGKRLLTDIGYGESSLPADLTIGTMHRLAEIAPTWRTRGMMTAATPEARETARRALESARLQTPYGVAQLTGDRAERVREDWLRNQTTMPEPAERMQNFGGVRQPGDLRGPSTQQGAIEAATGRLPAASDDAQEVFGKKLLLGMTATREAQYAAQKEAFEKLRATTGRQMRELPLDQQVNFDVSVSRDAFDRLARLDHVIQGSNPNKAIDLMAGLLANPSDVSAVRRHLRGTQGGGAPAPALRSMNLGDYNEQRRKLFSLWRGAENGEQKNIIREMIAQLDAAVDAGAASKAMTGPQEELGNLQEAMRLHRQFREFTQPRNQAAADFMEELRRPGVTGRQVADGLLNTADSPQILDHVTAMYPGNSPARELVRKALTESAVFGGKGKASDFMPGHVARRLDDALQGTQKEIYQRFFSQDELAEFALFRDGMRRMQEQVKLNSSGTAYVAPQGQLSTYIPTWLRQFTRPTGILSRTFGREWQAMQDAQRATTGRLPDAPLRDIDQPIGLVRRTAPAAGALTGDHREDAAAGARAVGRGAAEVAGAAGRGIVEGVSAADRGLLHFFNWDQPRR